MQQKTKLVGLAVCALFFYASPRFAQQVPIGQNPGNGAGLQQAPTSQPPGSGARPQQAPTGQPTGKGVSPPAAEHLSSYVLGPNDEVVLVSVIAEDIANKPSRITTSGDLTFPMVGRIHAAGMTLDQLQTEVSERLKTYYRDPDVVVNITQFKSQPVSVIGYVGSPGVIQLEGRKTLIEVLSQVGGLKQDAGSRIKITRKSEWGPIPLPSAKTQGDLSVAEVSVRGIETATSPEENIQILPNDIITVPRADIIYVLGEVKMPGGFALDERGRTISLIEVLARAGGATPTASLKNAKIVRAVPNANRVEIAVNLRDVTKGKAKDMVLQPDDILYVPNSYAKGAFRRTLDTVVNTATAVAIYRY